jgi:hypothetical protein
MAVNLSAFAGAGAQFFTGNTPLAGGKLYTYLAGTTTPATTYTTSLGNVASANPIVLDSEGKTTNEIWLTEGTVYKFVLKTSADVQIGVYDDISGINDFTNNPSNSSANVTFLQAGTGAVSRSVQSKLRDVVNVLDFGADGTGVADSTSAVQTAINSMPNGGRLVFTNHIKMGAITFPSGKPYLLEIDGQLTLTATLVLTNDVSLQGVGTGYSAYDQFGVYPLAKINPPAGNVPTIKVTGARNHSISNIQIWECEGAGIELDGETNLGALCRISNCSIHAKAGIATAVPIRVKTWFWLWVEHCSLYSWSGCLPYSILFEQSVVTSGGYTGLCNVYDTIINAHGFKITNSTSTTLSSEFVFKDVTYENCLNDAVIIENTGTSYISKIKLDNFLVADPAVTTYLLKTTGAVRNIFVTNCDANVPLFNPASEKVTALKTDNARIFPYTSGTEVYPTEAYSEGWNLSFSDAIDAKNLTTQSQPSVIPYTVLNVTQNVSSWVGESGGVVTTGKRAPDGTLTAAEIAGSSGGAVRVYDASHSVTIGDWLIGGVWVRSTEAAKPINQILLQWSDTTVRLNDGATDYIFADTSLESSRSLDGSWKWVPFAIKVTTAGTGTSNIRFLLKYVSTVGGICEWWNPCLILIPASASVSDFEAVRWSRNLNAFPNVGEAGTFALLNNQLLQLGGGVRHYSASAAPTTGTWKRGDVVWNTTPSAGGTPGWVCVTAGTPGTWKAMANLAV